jgi:hypothetical protein
VFDALGQQPARVVGREDGLIDTVNDMVTEVATGIRNTVDSAGGARTPCRKGYDCGDCP